MPRRLRARINSGFALVLALALGAAARAQTLAPAAAPAAKPTFEEWMQIELGGKRCGFGSTIVTPISTPAGTQYRTEMNEEFVVKRLGTSLKMTELSHVTEDARGVVLAFDQVSTSLGTNIEQHGVREGDDLVVTSRGQTQRYHIPPLAALGPEAIRRQTDAVPLKAGAAFVLHAFTTDYPQAVTEEKGVVVGRVAHPVGSTSRQLWKIVSETNITPGLKSVTWVDDANQDVEADVTIPGLGQLRQIVSTRAACMIQPEGAEVFASSLIAPQRPLTGLANLAVADYRLTTPSSPQKLGLWNGDEQRVLKSAPGVSEIEVTRRVWTDRDAAYTLPHRDTPDLHSYLQPSAYLESNAPDIRRLAREAIGNETNPVRAARRIEKYVQVFITKKDLNIGFASAEETAKSAEGDCTEHAVLCAALGRAVGLPTRCVVGLGYIPPGEAEPTISQAVDTRTGIFGFHMWAEGYVGPGRWVPMDAALGDFDVGHIAILKSALADINPMVDLNMPILTLMQDLHIEVLRTQTWQDLATHPAASAPARAAPLLPVSGID